MKTRAVPAPLTAALAVMLAASAAIAQSGGGGGGTAGGGGAAGGAATSGGAAGNSTTPGTVAPGLTSPEAPNATAPFSTVPQRGLGSPQVPSAGNAEPTSPINRQAQPLSNIGQGNTGTSSVSPEAGSPQLDQYPLGTGGAAGQGTGIGGTGTGGQALPGTPPESGGGMAPGRKGIRSIGAARGQENPANVEPKRNSDAHSMAACMKVWEPATHMTKEQWRTTCKRTLKSTPMNVLGP